MGDCTMTAFDVILIMIGFILIFVSFFLTEKVSAKSSKGNKELSSFSIDEDRLLEIQSTLEQNLTSLSEATIIKTENALNKVTNEKIMAISDYSDQILEKIDQNHTEVVFLYNMLNEKENSVKEIVATRNMNPNANSTTTILSENVSEESKVHDTNKRKPKNKRSSIPSNNDNQEDENQNVKVVNIDEIVTPSYDTDEQDMNTDSKENNNKQIIKLYSEGKSITEIAKLLELGKGEIKFVINLYQQRNNG
jgi:hypothetical protein